MLKIIKLIKNYSIKKNDIVLEIGSGANPLIRADVLLDKFPILTKEHRTSMKAVKLDGRPFIVGDAHNIPFIDDSFDFIIARHVLEHLDHPETFISELKRVGKRGFLATPSPFTELVHGGYIRKNNNIPKQVLNELKHGEGTPGHKWFVLGNKESIIMEAKAPEHHIMYLMLGFFIKNNTQYDQRKFLADNRDWLETKILWKRENLNLEITKDIVEKDNENVDIDELVGKIHTILLKKSFKSQIKEKIRNLFFSTKKKFNIYDIMACPQCKTKLLKETNRLVCSKCGSYPIINEIPILLPEILNYKE